MMAEAPVVLKDRPLEDLKREITCTVCQSIYHEAKLLPCNHYYCSMCIEKKAARAGEGRPFECPDCCKETTVPDGGVTELPHALFVERNIEVYQKMAKAEGKIEPGLCGQCAVGNAVAFCRHCGDFVCKECVSIHDKLKFLSVHAVVSFEELKQGGLKNVPLKENPPKKCSTHKKSLKLFCYDCKCFICRDCTVFDHSGHKFEFLDKCACESKKSLNDALAPLQTLLTDIAEAEKRLVSEETNVDQREQDAYSSIQQCFEKLKSMLDARKGELMREVGVLARKKRDALGPQKIMFQNAWKEIQLVVELVERNIEGTSNEDIMTIVSSLESKIEEEAKRHVNVSLDLSATADISWYLPSLSIIPKDVGLVYDESSPPKLFNSVQVAEIHTPVTMMLAAPGVKNRNDITVVFRNVTKFVTHPDVTQICAGMFKISFTPDCRGRSELIIKVNDIPIKGSPFNLFVNFKVGSVSPRSISSHCGPLGVAINSKQQLIVSETYSDKVEVVNKNGDVVFKMEDYSFRDPRGVAVGKDGCIYVTDSYANRHFTFNSNGELQYKSSRLSERPYYVKIINGKLYVAYYENNQIGIYDMEWTEMGTIKTPDLKPLDIAQGPDGLLYVVGGKTISVFSLEPDGHLLRQLKLSPASLKINNLKGICFNGCGNILTTECYGGVFVFDTNGQCLGQMGQELFDERRYGATGITVDNDGFVYFLRFTHHGTLFVI